MEDKEHLTNILLVMALGVIACVSTPLNTGGVTVPTPSGSTTNGEIAMPTAEALPLPTATPVTITTQMTATFVADNSGSLCPKRTPDLILGAPSFVGEVDDEWRCEGYWTFDIFNLPAYATILSATFRPGNCQMTGDPFIHSELYFGYNDIGTIEISDYGGPGSQETSYQKCPDSIDVSNYVKASLQNSSRWVQILTSFDASDYGNGTGDYISFQGSTPLLTIEYSYLQNE